MKGDNLYFQFNGYWKFNFPLQLLIRGEESRVRIVATVGDQTMQESFTGFSEVLVEEEKVIVEFVGPDNHFIDAENPFDTLVLNLDSNTIADCDIAGIC